MSEGCNSLFDSMLTFIYLNLFFNKLLNLSLTYLIIYIYKLFLENTSFSSFSTDTSGFVILNENGTSLIPKTVVSSIYTRTKSSTGNTIILVLIKITGGVGATLVFVNIFLCLHHHCERKRSISSHKKVSNTTL